MTGRALAQLWEYDQRTEEVFQRDYYNFPMVAGVYMKLTGIARYLTPLYLACLFPVLLFHVWVFSENVMAIMKDSYVLALFELQLDMLVLLVLVMVVFILSKRRQINAFYSESMYQMFEYESPDLEFADKVKKESRRAKLQLLAGPVFAGLSGANVVIAGPYLDSAYGTVTFNTTARSWNLPIRLMVYPTSLETNLGFYSAVTCQLLATWYVATIVSAASYMFFTGGLELCSHLKLLNRAIDRLEERATDLAGLSTSPTGQYFASTAYLSSYSACLKRCVQHHQLILRWMKLFDEIFGFLVGIWYITGTLVIALSMTSINTASSLPGTFASSVILCAGEIFFMGAISHIGQLITDLSEELRFKIYSSQWYVCPKHIALDFEILLEVTLKPMTLQGLGIFKANNDTFSSVINSSYSYYNLMKAM